MHFSERRRQEDVRGPALPPCILFLCFRCLPETGAKAGVSKTWGSSVSVSHSAGGTGQRVFMWLQESKLGRSSCLHSKRSYTPGHVPQTLSSGLFQTNIYLEGTNAR